MLVLKSPKFCVAYANRELATFTDALSSVFGCRNLHIAMDTVDFLSEETETVVNFLCVSGQESSELFGDTRKVDLLWSKGSGRLEIDGTAHPLRSLDCAGAIAESIDLLCGIGQDSEFLA